MRQGHSARGGASFRTAWKVCSATRKPRGRRRGFPRTQDKGLDARETGYWRRLVPGRVARVAAAVVGGMEEAGGRDGARRDAPAFQSAGDGRSDCPRARADSLAAGRWTGEISPQSSRAVEGGSYLNTEGGRGREPRSEGGPARPGVRHGRARAKLERRIRAIRSGLWSRLVGMLETYPEGGVDSTGEACSMELLRGARRGSRGCGW